MPVVGLLYLFYPSTKIHCITFHSDGNFGNYFINYMEVLSEINGNKKLLLNYCKLLEELFKCFTAIFLHDHNILPYKKFAPFKKICMHYGSMSTSQKLIVTNIMLWCFIHVMTKILLVKINMPKISVMCYS
jgi:hypothetical protein